MEKDHGAPSTRPVNTQGQHYGQGVVTGAGNPHGAVPAPERPIHYPADGEANTSKKILNFLGKEVSAIRLLEEIKELQNRTKRKRIVLLEKIVVDLEQYTRENNIL